MHPNLAPTYQKSFDNHFLLWFSNSNSYSVVDSTFKDLLDIYFQSDCRESFKTNLADSNNTANYALIIKTIERYLKECNKVATSPDTNSTVTNCSPRTISKQYIIKDKTISVYYGSEYVLNAIHPALAHLGTKKSRPDNLSFDVYVKNDQLLLFKNEILLSAVPKKEYHRIQGKFIMSLFCAMYDQQEENWIGTFHGSTITDNHNAILFVGKSGKGKSTLCAILAAQGFKLLADDVSPMLEDTSIYHNPSALSIKEGAFNTLKPIVSNFDQLPSTIFNKAKGSIKYIPCETPKKYHYPCRAIILVNYKSKATTKLETASIKTLLETLIPDSWLSPNPVHAKQFLDWLETVNVYTLTYSDTKSVTQEISSLFKQLRNPS